MTRPTTQTPEQKAEKEAAKAAKFKTLAENRTRKALNAIAALRGLSNKNNYTYTDEQVTKILEALKGEVVTLASKFADPAAKDDTAFIL